MSLVPYRFYLRHIVGVRAEAESERPYQQQRQTLGRLIRRILSSWAREYEHFKSDRTWFEYTDSASYLKHCRAADSRFLGGVGRPRSARERLGDTQ